MNNLRVRHASLVVRKVFFIFFSIKKAGRLTISRRGRWIIREYFLPVTPLMNIREGRSFGEIFERKIGKKSAVVRREGIPLITAGWEINKSLSTNLSILLVFVSFPRSYFVIGSFFLWATEWIILVVCVREYGRKSPLCSILWVIRGFRIVNNTFYVHKE